MTEEKRTAGRPKALSDEERRNRILDAAGALFIEAGYEATDMKRIAERCGMSKKTLYLVFQNKEDLFATLVCDPRAYASAPDVDLAGASGEARLVEILLRLAMWVLAPRQIGLTRLIIAEAFKTPELAGRFREQAIEIGRRSIIAGLDFLSGPTRTGPDVEQLASLLFGAAIADLQLRALVGENIEEARQEDRLRENIRLVVQSLLRADGTGPDHLPPETPIRA
ncbi:TetR/AcrR family transcriptional regulator [Rhodobacter capsulatus]|uniref:TetR/AcrR family transcriptional regulator n=1 Tax=Rhodobacter capsulatus TaxID=1061 RepID=A0A4U1JQX2_RHOCA|nr:TetR/AcrR family transcriptional regulator [Rhodobacter capsulatus]TKD21407.1 TetR/AcrR family transcriptional regulator [Rhodobacter capsulatus]